MINIYFNKSYFDRKRIFLTKKIKYTKFLVPYYNLCYKFNYPVNNNLIYSGPQKRINHLIKAFRKSSFTFNKDQFNNHYIVQYDDFGKNILKNILKNNKKSQKIIIGPLMDIKSMQELTEMTQKFDNIKILVASETGFKNLTEEMEMKVDFSNVLVIPSGIEFKNKINHKNRSGYSDALIYFKKRQPEELQFIKDFLDKKRINYKLIEYGKYSNNKLTDYINSSKFGILLSGTESQGFAVQEMLSKNLPLYVWDKKINHYGGYNLSGTSVSMWNKNCGEIVNDKKEFEENFDFFFNNLKNYSPSIFVENNLTYEKFEQNLINSFNSF